MNGEARSYNQPRASTSSVRTRRTIVQRPQTTQFGKRDIAPTPPQQHQEPLSPFNPSYTPQPPYSSIGYSQPSYLPPLNSPRPLGMNTYQSRLRFYKQINEELDIIPTEPLEDVYQKILKALKQFQLINERLIDVIELKDASKVISDYTSIVYSLKLVITNSRGDNITNTVFYLSDRKLCIIDLLRIDPTPIYEDKVVNCKGFDAIPERTSKRLYRKINEYLRYCRMLIFDESKKDAPGQQAGTEYKRKEKLAVHVNRDQGIEGITDFVMELLTAGHPIQLKRSDAVTIIVNNGSKFEMKINITQSCNVVVIEINKYTKIATPSLDSMLTALYEGAMKYDNATNIMLIPFLGTCLFYNVFDEAQKIRLKLMAEYDLKQMKVAYLSDWCPLKATSELARHGVWFFTLTVEKVKLFTLVCGGKDDAEAFIKQRFKEPLGPLQSMLLGYTTLVKHPLADKDILKYSYAEEFQLTVLKIVLSIYKATEKTATKTLTEYKLTVQESK